MSHLVGNPEDRFSHNEAQIYIVSKVSTLMPERTSSHKPVNEKMEHTPFCVKKAQLSMRDNVSLE